jgi:adenine-specific DNA methylase
VQITRLSLWIQTAHNKTALVSLDENIKCGNSLIDDTAIDPKAFKWEEEFPFKFDVVVGNPPYVLVQNLTNSMFQYFRNIYKVSQYKIDLYQIFIEQGLKLLKNNGYLSYITPNTFLKNKHSVNLRQIILQKSLTSLRLYNFSVFDGVSVDTLVFVIKNTQYSDNVCKVDFSNDVTTYESKIYNQSQWNDIISFSQSDIISKIESQSKLLKEMNIRVYFGIQTHSRQKYVADYKKDNTIINKLIKKYDTR